MRVAIVIGHNARAQGASRVTDGVSEYVWNGNLAERIQRLDPKSVRVFKRTPGNGEISRAYAQVAEWGADCAVELHFNAAASAQANGCEALWGKSPDSKDFAAVMQRHMLSALGNRDRGLLDRRTGNGSTSLNQEAQPVVLVEPYFGSNAGECKLADSRKDDLARAIYGACREFLGVPAPREQNPVAGFLAWLGSVFARR